MNTKLISKKIKGKFFLKLCCILFTMLIIFIFIFIMKVYNTVYHTVTDIPCGLNISIYGDSNGRGFSWWTEYSGKSKNESFLFLSEEPFNEDSLHTAVKEDADLNQESINGIILIEGNSNVIDDPTRIGKIFFLNYCAHSAYIEDLRSNEQYYYAVGGNGNFVFGDFTTDTDKKTTIVNFNDFQTSIGEKLDYGEKTLSAALQVVNDEIDFYAFGGDFTGVFNIDDKRYNHYLGWIKSRESLSSAIKNTPMIMVSGNHDVQNSLFVSNNVVNYQKKQSNGGYYSFDYNNIHITVLNSNSLDDEQYDWLKKDLSVANENENTNWIMLITHIGPYTTGDHGFVVEDKLVERISQLCSAYHVDLVLQAHDHTYSKTLPYRWNAKGFSENVNDQTIFPEKIIVDGIECDNTPQGTYYVSCGASGHRIGENEEYAASTGEKSYTNRKYKVAIGQINLTTDYATIGDNASADLGHTMFGIINVSNNILKYDFYVVNDNGDGVLFDRLAIYKE